MSFPKLICIYLAFTMAATAFAGSDATEKTDWSNWQWSVAVIQEPTLDLDTLALDLDTLVRFAPDSLAKIREVVEKTCSELKGNLSELANLTFYDNPPFEGRIVVTLTVHRQISWSVIPPGSLGRWAYGENRAVEVNELLMGNGDPSDLNQAEELPLVEHRDLVLRDKGKGFEVVAARVDLTDLDSTRLSAQECPKGYNGRPVLKELTRMVAADIVRIVARKKGMVAPSTDSALRR